MEHYEEYARESGICTTGIHTTINETHRVSSIYRKFANSHFESWGWETFLWNGKKIQHQYTVLNSAEEVVTLHSKIAKQYGKTVTFYEEN